MAVKFKSNVRETLRVILVSGHILTRTMKCRMIGKTDHPAFFHTQTLIQSVLHSRQHSSTVSDCKDLTILIFEESHVAILIRVAHNP